MGDGINVMQFDADHRVIINGVFEGGGIKGIALAGAAAAALDSGHTFNQVAGTSAGALVASLVAAGYEADELRREVCRIDWPSMLDAAPTTRLPYIGKHMALLLHRGIYRGLRLERVWRDLLARKGVHTFGDLTPGTLRMVATDLHHSMAIVLPDDLSRYGFDPNRFSIARAVRMSSSIPFVFQPVMLPDRLTGETILAVDGALASRFPVELMDQGGEVAVYGFRLVDDDTEHPHFDITGPATLAAAVMSAGMAARETLPSGRFESVTQIRVPALRDPLDFDLTSTDALEMFERGYEAAMREFAIDDAVRSDVA